MTNEIPILKESHIIGDFNINIYQNNKFIVRDDNMISSFQQYLKLSPILHNPWLQTANKIPDPRNFWHFNSYWSYSSKFPFKSFSERCLWRRNIWSKPIFCTRKISRLKTAGIHKYLNFRSFVNYTVDSYKKDLKQLDFPNYETFDDVNGAHCNFFQKIMTALIKLLLLSIEIK